MTLRERIADWISGGALSEARKNEDDFQWVDDGFIIADLQSRLDRIAAQETTNANATVRRMARIARGEA